MMKATFDHAHAKFLMFDDDLSQIGSDCLTVRIFIILLSNRPTISDLPNSPISPLKLETFHIFLKEFQGAVIPWFFDISSHDS